MAKQKKDGIYFHGYLDKNVTKRLEYYAEEKGQSKTLAIERILTKHFDEEGIPKTFDDRNASES